jgi:poly(A) polymerase
MGRNRGYDRQPFTAAGMARVSLADAPWRHMPGLGLICRSLGSDDGRIRLVGGAVRDGLASQPVTDVDLATSFLPDEVMTRLRAAGIKVIPTGLAHGTVTAVMSSGTFEITTLRRDVATDGRHATVAYTDDWQADAARRDFTINALFADPFTGEVFDYFGGVTDLAEGRVRFIGEPGARIAEDHLRIMRFFRFYARYGRGTPDEAALKACTERANDLMALSRERIADELFKILAFARPDTVIALMIGCGIFRPVLPEIVDAAPLTRLVDRELKEGIAPDPVRRLAALLPADRSVAEAVAARLKLSNAIRQRLARAAERDDRDGANPLALAYWQGRETAIDRLLLGDGDIGLLTQWDVPTLPLSGGAIVARGVKAGPDVARLLKSVEQQWVAEGFPDTARADAIADQIVAQSFSEEPRSRE